MDGPSFWNQVPSSIRSSVTVGIFKHGLKLTCSSVFGFFAFMLLFSVNICIVKRNDYFWNCVIFKSHYYYTIIKGRSHV